MHLENCIRKKKTEKIEDKEKQRKKVLQRRSTTGRKAGNTGSEASLEEGFIKCQDIDEGRATTGQVTKSAG